MTTMPRWIWALAPLCLAFPAGCPSADDDDDTTVADDDDTTVADDDDTTVADDDDTTADDDDDTTPGQDYDAATVPVFADCEASANEWMATLGDGTALGPFGGFSPAPASFANNNGQWTLRLGAGATFAQLQGNRGGYTANTPIPMQGPAATAGNVVANVLIDAGELGAAPVALATGYGLPNVNADVRVLGTVTFTSLPEPGTTTTGTFEAILQSSQQLGMGNIVLLGIRGCFSADLVAQD